jgi:hypothetical protein
MQVHGHGRDIYVEGKRVCMEMGAPSNMVWATRSPYFSGFLSLEQQKGKKWEKKRGGLKKGCLVSGGTSKSFLRRTRHLYDPWRWVGVVAVFTQFAPT